MADDLLGKLVQSMLGQRTPPDGPPFEHRIVPQPDRVAECHDCAGSGYATTMAGRSLGECSTCEGWGHIFVDDADHHDHVAPADHAYDLPGVPK